MRLAVNGFLLRVGTPKDSISEPALDHVHFLQLKQGHLVEHDGGPADDVSPGVVVALFRRPSRIPAWQSFINEVTGAEGFDVPAMSLGAIVYCLVDDPAGGSGEKRWVAWCFGAGARILRRRASDPRFGLLISLNLLADAQGTSGRPPRLRNLQYRVTAPYFQQAGHQASRDIPVEGFRVETDSDLVSAAGGLSESEFGDVLGGRSIRFRAGISDLRDFVSLSEAALGKWHSDSYRNSFRWVDNLTPVYDENLIEELRTELLEFMLQEPVPPFVDVLLPDDLVALDDDRSIHYVAYPGERSTRASRTTLTPEMVSALLRGIEDDAESGLDRQLRFLDSSRDVLGSASILECICGEFSRDGDSFVVYDGDFYLVDSDFVAAVDAEIRNIPRSEIELPCYQGGTEPSYTERVRQQANDRVAILDRRLVRMPGETPFEACDLVDVEGRLVHLKRKGKSATFNHLCFQASNACQLLRRSGDARELLCQEIRNSGADADVISAAIGHLADLSEGGELEVTFGILGMWGQRDLTNLPLLSRMSLAQTVRRLSELGYRPTSVLIDFC